MTEILITGTIVGVPSGLFLLGYWLGRRHELQAWEIWLKARRS